MEVFCVTKVPFALLIATLLLGVVACFADEPVNVTITARYAVVASGYRYYLTVQNDSDPVKNAHVNYFAVELVPASDLVCPTDWSAYVFYPHHINWSTTTMAEWWKGVPPGSILSGFQFTAPTLPADIAYWGGAANELGSYGFYGRMLPTPIPEPSSALALGSALAMLAILLQRRQRSSARIRPDLPSRQAAS